MPNFAPDATAFDKTQKLVRPKRHHSPWRAVYFLWLLLYCGGLTNGTPTTVEAGVYRKFVTIIIAALGVAAGLGIGFAAVQRAANRAVWAERLPTETATFAGGCFWSLEAAFRQVRGVTDTAVGYSGGTDHLEACRVTFDPAQISYEDLVAYFLQIHSPPVAGRKVPYLGSPGRLVIFFHSAQQESLAKALKEKLPQPESGRRSPVVEVLPEGQFDRAEEYHQRYLEKHGLASCRVGS